MPNSSRSLWAAGRHDLNKFPARETRAGKNYRWFWRAKRLSNDAWAAESVWAGLRVNLHHLPVQAQPAGQAWRLEVLALQRVLEVGQVPRVLQEPPVIQAPLALQAPARLVQKGLVAIEGSVPRLLLRARRQLLSGMVAVPLSEQVAQPADGRVLAQALKEPLALVH